MRIPIDRLWPLGVIIAVLPLAACQTDKGATWPAFGKYRMPYADGTHVRVNNDFTTHSPLGRYDIEGLDGSSFSIVAAADGWVRFIVDDNTGSGTGDNNYVWIEHPFPYCQPQGVTWPGKPPDYDQTCVPCEGICNEWTKYSHMAPDSTRGDAGLSEGAWVTAGTFLGYEDDIGHAHGTHLHWEVAKVDPAHPFSSEANGWVSDWSGGGWVGSPNVLPSICGIGIMQDGDTYTAGPCPETSHLEQQTTLTLDWQSGDGAPVVAQATIGVTGPDRANRLSISSLELTSPVVFGYGGTKVTVKSLRLVRPVTIPLTRDGHGRLSADQLIWHAVAYRDGDGASGLATGKRRHLPLFAGPVRGWLDIKRAGSTIHLSLESELGTISGAGIIHQPTR